MFSNRDVDYSLNRPCRTLSAVAPPPSKSPKSTAKNSALDENDGDIADGTGHGWEDDDEDYLGTSSLTSHKFLVGSAIPSVSKLNAEQDDFLDYGEEGDESRINRIYLLDYNEDSHELTQDSSWVHPTGEVWSVGCHPTRRDWVVTCGGGSASASNVVGGEDGEQKKNNIPLTKFQTTLWRLPALDDNDNGSDDFDFSDSGGSHRHRTESSLSALTRLEPLATIPHGEKNVSLSSSGWEQRVGQILWNPLYDLGDISSNEAGGNLITVGWNNQSPISKWDMSSLSTVTEVWSNQGSGVASSRKNKGFDQYLSSLPRRVAWWDPNQILATSGVDVVAYDMRSPASSNPQGVIRSAHRYGVSDICYNQLQSDKNVVVTAGMDGVVKFWDLRMHLSGDCLNANGDNASFATSMPPPLLKVVRGGHSHWVTRAIFNKFYDQLVLSGDCEGITNLWRISSCSSAPLLDLNDEVEDSEGIGEGSFHDDGMEEGNEEDRMDDEQPASLNCDDDDYHKEDKSKASRKSESNAHDVRVTSFECSDVIADLTWSASDPWIYATLSCDGVIVVHHVPSREKYKILL